MYTPSTLWSCAFFYFELEKIGDSFTISQNLYNLQFSGFLKLGIELVSPKFPH